MKPDRASDGNASKRSNGSSQEEYVEHPNYYNARTQMTMVRLRQTARDITPQSVREEFEAIPRPNANGDELPREYEFLSRDTKYIPFSKNRIKVNPDATGSKSDYINASFIKSMHPESRPFIITQAPQSGASKASTKAATCDAFWDMIWTKEVRTIVMIEGPAAYLPHGTVGIPQRHGVYQVSIQSSIPKAAAILTTIELSLQGNTNPRTIDHYTFLNWPEDAEVPPNIGTFLAFHKEIELDMNDGPIVVHDLYGGVKAGTFVIAENALVQAQSGSINLVSLIQELHTERSPLIESTTVFSFLYHVVSKFARKNNKVPGPPSYVPTPKFEATTPTPNEASERKLTEMEPPPERKTTKRKTEPFKDEVAQEDFDSYYRKLNSQELEAD
eukprot:m.275041 g.275041  ORF g.275041 m.275041 type:complete len:387 (+) comp16292_c0_seq15:964-2124(+)